MSTSQPTLEDVWRLFQETDRLLKQQAQEAERRSQETDRKLQELGKQIGRLGGACRSLCEVLPTIPIRSGWLQPYSQP